MREQASISPRPRPAFGGLMFGGLMFGGLMFGGLAFGGLKPADY
jgi:hypothetical protein